MHFWSSPCDIDLARVSSRAMLSLLLSPRSMMKHLSIVAVLALLGSSSAIPQNVPGGRLFAPGSRGDRGGGAPGASAAEKHFENEELLCSGDM